MVSTCRNEGDPFFDRREPLGISRATRDQVTFTITLPDNGIPFERLTEALNNEAQKQARIGNIYAAQTLRVVYALAERGRLAFVTDTEPPSILKE